MEIKTNLFLPGKNNERDARRKILEWLIQGDYTPDDILDKLIILKFKCEYIPHYLFTVDWAAGWAAEVGHSREVTYTEYETQYDDNGKSHFTGERQKAYQNKS